MGVTVAVTRAAANTGTGTQTFSTSDMGGLTPKAALFIATYATSDGTAANEAVLSFGAATGASNRFAISFTSEHGQADTDCDHEHVSTQCIRINNPGAQTVNGEADFDSFTTNGVIVDWTDAPGSAFLVTVVLFGGTDLSAHANYCSPSNTEDASVDVTDPGFEPDVLFVPFHMRSEDAGAVHGKLSLGFVHNDGASTITERSLGYFGRTGRASGEPSSRSSNTRAALSVGIGASVSRSFQFDTFDSSGFSVTTRDGANFDDVVPYLALSFGGVASSYVGTHTAPTSTGNQSSTAPGFTPQALFMICTNHLAVDTAYTNDLAGSWAFSVITSTAQFCNSNSEEDGAATTNTQSLSDNVAIEFPEDDGSAGYTASFVSFDANGWTLNFSAHRSANDLFFVLAIEESVAGGISIPVVQHHRQQQQVGQ